MSTLTNQNARHAVCRAGQRSRSTAVRVFARVHTVELRLPNGKTAVIKASSDGPCIYDAAMFAGVSLPASCRQGSCTACCAKVVSGKVSTKGQSCVPPSLAREGYVALCVAHPASDVAILTHQGRVVRQAKQEQQQLQHHH